jgi:hypothetical protein
VSVRRERDKPHYWLDIDDLFEVFTNYRTKHAMYRAIRLGQFPIKTFKLGQHIYCDKEAVRLYFKRMRDEAIASLEESE